MFSCLVLHVLLVIQLNSFNRVIDTTNRLLVMNAQKDGFDSDGFKKGKPLQKDLFYMNPYITCSWCNTMNYVDVLAVRRMLTLPESIKSQIQGESLPPCEGCGRADGFEVGANDFMDLIEQRKRYSVIFFSLLTSLLLLTSPLLTSPSHFTSTE